MIMASAIELQCGGPGSGRRPSANYYKVSRRVAESAKTEDQHSRSASYHILRSNQFDRDAKSETGQEKINLNKIADAHRAAANEHETAAEAAGDKDPNSKVFSKSAQRLSSIAHKLDT